MIDSENVTPRKPTLRGCMLEMLCSQLEMVEVVDDVVMIDLKVGACRKSGYQTYSIHVDLPSKEITVKQPVRHGNENQNENGNSFEPDRDGIGI